MCKNNAQCVQNKFWSPRDAFIAKTDMLSPVYSKCVHNISLLYKCTQNQFAVQAYSKPVYCKGVQKTRLMYTQNQFTVHLVCANCVPVDKLFEIS